jgi:hypothetical protein
MTWKSQDDQTSALLAIKGVEKADVAGQPSNWFFRVVADCWRAVRGYAADDISRLKEAGVLQVEAKAQKDLAEAKEKIANAARLHAEAEKFRSEAYAIRVTADTNLLEAQVKALERIEAIISAIRQKGGSVAFDTNEIARHILRGLERFPNDPALKAAERELVPDDRDDRIVTQGE